MKKCPRCKEIKLLVEFRIRTKSKDGLQSWCRICSNIARMDSYRKDPSVNRKNHVLRKQRNRKFIKNFLYGKKCMDCPENDPVALQFDHRKGKKIDTVSSMAGRGLSIEKIVKEIEKCEIRCANCHLKRHSKERKNTHP